MSRLFLTIAAIALASLVSPPQARADDECGAGASASLGFSRYQSFSPTEVYSPGAVVRIGNSLYRKLTPEGGAPSSSAPANGWSAPLAQSEYAENEIICDGADSVAAGIRYDDADLAIIYQRPSGVAEFIRHIGDGGEIHIRAGAVSRTISRAVSIRSASADAIAITTASGTSVSAPATNTDAIEALSSGGGNIYMSLAGDTTTGQATGIHRNSDAIRAQTNANGNIDIDIVGGTHKTLGSQSGRNSATIVLNAVNGLITLDIAQDARVESLGVNRRAIEIISSNTTQRTERTITSPDISGNDFIGNRVTNRGFIKGAIYSHNALATSDSATPAANLLLENHGTIEGGFFLEGGAFSEYHHELINRGTIIITNNAGGFSSISGGDLFINMGALEIDTTSPSDTIFIHHANRFIQHDGVMRFKYNPADDNMRGKPLLHFRSSALTLIDGRTLGAPLSATFRRGRVELILTAGSIAANTDITLITGLDSVTVGGIGSLTTPYGTLSIDRESLILRTRDRISPSGTPCGSIIGSPSATEIREIVCAGGYPQGIFTSANNIAIRALSSGGSGAPFIHHHGTNGEIHIARGTVITRRAGVASDNRQEALRVLHSGERGAIVIEAGASVINGETANFAAPHYSHAHAAYVGVRTGDAEIGNAGSVRTAGGNAHALFAISFSDFANDRVIGDASVSTSGDIATIGDGAIAISAQSNRSRYSDGNAAGNASITITGGDIRTQGGIRTGEASAFKTSAYAAYAGLRAIGTARIAMSGGAVSTSGAAAIGLFALAWGETVGSVTTDGDVDMDITGGSVRTTGISGVSESVSQTERAENMRRVRLQGAYGIYGSSRNEGDVDIDVAGASVITGCASATDPARGCGEGMFAERGEGAHGVFGLAYDATTTDGTGGGAVSITAGADARIHAHGADAYAIYGATGGVGEATLNGAGAVNINIMDGARVSASGARGAAVALYANTGSLTLDIAQGAVVCAGTLGAGDICAPGDADGLAAVRMGRAPGQVAPERTPNRFVNRGTITGDIAFESDRDSFIFDNHGDFTGTITKTTGASLTINNYSANTFTLNADLTLGAGDSFMNREGARLVLLQNARITGGRLVIEENAIIQIILTEAPSDPIIDSERRVSLPASAALDFTGSAPGISNIQLFSDRARPSGGIMPQNIRGAVQNGDGTLQIVTESSDASLQTYDALIQSAWHTDRALGRQMISAQRDPSLGMALRSWGRVGGRLTRHRPSAGFQYDEDAYAILVGAHWASRDWSVVVAAGYEGAEIDPAAQTREPLFSAEANRFLLALGIASQKRRPQNVADIDLHARMAYADFKTERKDNPASATSDGDAEIFSLAIAVGAEKHVVSQERARWRSRLFFPSSEIWELTPRIELGTLAINLNRFSEIGGNAPLNLSETSETLAYARSSFEARYQAEGVGGAKLSARFRAGVDVFLSDPQSRINATNSSGRQLSAQGNLDNALFDVAIGLGYNPINNMEISLAYEGLVSVNRDTVIHSLSGRFNYHF